jgi:hypothetical protein
MDVITFLEQMARLTHHKINEQDLALLPESYQRHFQEKNSENIKSSLSSSAYFCNELDVVVITRSA